MFFLELIISHGLIILQGSLNCLQIVFQIVHEPLLCRYSYEGHEEGRLEEKLHTEGHEVLMLVERSLTHLDEDSSQLVNSCIPAMLYLIRHRDQARALCPIAVSIRQFDDPELGCKSKHVRLDAIFRLVEILPV